jgi:hypothetical protein
MPRVLDAQIGGRIPVLLASLAGPGPPAWLAELPPHQQMTKCSGFPEYGSPCRRPLPLTSPHLEAWRLLLLSSSCWEVAEF